MLCGTNVDMFDILPRIGYCFAECVFLFSGIKNYTIMIIVVNHKIKDVAGFWGSAQQSLPKLPENGVKRVLQVLPNADNTEATCLWEAEDIATLNRYLREKVGDMSSETYHEVNTAGAMGLPA